MMLKNIHYGFIFLFLLLFTENVVSAPVCSVPVCDIPSKIAELSVDTQENRSNYYSYLNKAYKSNRDVNVLTNLIEFSLEAHKLSLSLDATEEWIPNLAAEILNRSLVYALTQGPLNNTIYTRWFGLFYGDSASAYRFSILLHWEKELKKYKLTTATELRALIAFCNQAARVAVQRGDEDYVSILAENISVQAGLQLLRIAPHMEGIFSVRVACHIVDKDHCPKIDKMSIMIGDEYRGIQTAFISTNDANLPVFEFLESKIKNENTLYGLTGPTDQTVPPGSVEIEFDSTTHTFKGVLITPRTQIKIQISGQRIVSPQDLYDMPQPTPLIAIDQISQNYLGHLLKSPHFDPTVISAPDFYLKVDRYSGTLFKATMRDAVSKHVLYDFPALYYSPTNGVMTAYTVNQVGPVKMTWAYRILNGIPSWVGFAHSQRNGQYYYLNLEAK
jgi:hypothetical protein